MFDSIYVMFRLSRDHLFVKKDMLLMKNNSHLKYIIVKVYAFELKKRHVLIQLGFLSCIINMNKNNGLKRQRNQQKNWILEK